MLKQKINASIKILICLSMAIFADTGPTVIKQTYRFKTLPDDGSYSLILSKISGDLIISGNEGSGAFINVEKITFGIKKEDIPNIRYVRDSVAPNMTNVSRGGVVRTRCDSL